MTMKKAPCIIYRKHYLDEDVSSSTLTDTRITMRVHYPDRPVVERSEVQDIYRSGS